MAHMLAEHERPEWFDHARCRELGVAVDVFFPPLTPEEYIDRRPDSDRAVDSIAVALEVCAGCALDHHEIHGVWGGMSPRARRRLHRDRDARGL